MIIHIDGIDRESTAEETSALKAEQAEIQKAIEKAKAEKAAAKQAVLDKLGLAAEEVAALLA